jgi:site-specific DNA recombinase
MTRRAAIYARFSSDHQNDKSCRDQIDLCAGWADRQGIDVVASFQDDAVSGASTINRPGLGNLLRAARLARFDVLICEDLDRLSRKQADLHKFRDELTFLGIAIMTVSDGNITAMHAGLKGLMSEMFLTDLANKTRRGLRARVADGASGGGKSYGYDVVPGRPGEHAINPREADVVRRIFTDYAAGRTPREIAAKLNAEGVPGPRGGKWNSSTLNGSRSRANGVLQNRLYIGELVWNRQRFVKDPSTGKRVSRLNPESEWVRTAVPDLAIVDATLFARAAGRKESRSADRGPVAARPRHLLSGLIKCGCCGASYTVMGNDRLGCSGFRERGDCSNNRTVTRLHVEGRVLAALESHLADPELLAEYVSEFHARLRQRQASEAKQRSAIERRHAELTRAIERIVDQVCDGTATKALVGRLTGMEAEQEALAAELADLDAQHAPIALHPAAAENYRRICANLQDHLAKVRAGEPSDELLARARDLIDRVDLHPGQTSKEPVGLTLHGLLSSLLVGHNSDSDPGFRGVVVAGAGFEPATFRL